MNRALLEQKRVEAKQRAELRANRSPEAQLERLDKLLGEGVGAVKERTRLHTQIQNRSSGEKLLKEVFEKPPKRGRQPKGKRGKKS